MNEIQADFRSKVTALESGMKSLPQASVPVEHEFGGGMCARTIRIPAGTCLVGAIHLHPQINIVHGDISIMSEDGECRYTGYHVISSPAGTKRVGYAHAETFWTTILKTDETEPEVIEKTLTAQSFDDPRLVEGKENNLILEEN